MLMAFLSYLGSRYSAHVALVGMLNEEQIAPQSSNQVTGGKA